MSHKSLEEITFSVNVDLHEYIHEEYRVKDIQLLWFRNDCYRGITADDRKDVFNLY